MTRSSVFATTFATLLTAHQIGDHWFQTDYQARTKGQRDWAGRRACAAHVGTYTATGAAVIAVTKAVTRVELTPAGMAAGLAVSGLSHYWIDRRFTLANLARRCGKSNFYNLGTPRSGRDDNPSLGTGAYALDQSAHVGMIWAAALVAAAVTGRRPGAVQG